MDSLSQFADKRIKRRQTRINIVRGNDDDDKQSIKRFPKRKVERHLTQKDEKIRDISLDPENSTTILNLVPMNTDQPKINI
jgi:predicted phosphodiesterase